MERLIHGGAYFSNFTVVFSPSVNREFLYYKLDMGDPAQGIEKGELQAGLQITVFHQTLADQNLLASDEIPPMFRYYVWRIENTLSLK